MNYIGVPLTFSGNPASGIRIARNINLKNKTAMIDNLVELIIFTPRGSFKGDPDFGLEYWNQEYVNINDNEFNNYNTSLDTLKASEIAGREVYATEISARAFFEENIKQSLMSYTSDLTDIEVSMKLDSENTMLVEQKQDRVRAQRFATIRIKGYVKDDYKTEPYERIVTFMIEPIAKKKEK